MTPAEALDEIRDAARLGQLRYTKHAQERMHERNAKRADVERACLTATGAVWQRDDVWKVTGGVDLDGDSLGIIAAIDPGDVWVITVTG